MDEADRCSRVGLLYEGRLIICADPEAIRGQIQGDLIELRPQDWQKAHRMAQALPGVLEVQTYGEVLHLLVDSAQERLTEIKRALRERDIGYRSIRQATPRMEEAFISLVRRAEKERES
jgi:ABC-2 type transport system ATP-binding protein